MRPELPERRRLTRFPAPDLEATLKCGRGLRARWQPVKAFDFTRSGLSIASPRPLEVGESVELNLRLPLASGDLVADRLVARVQNVQADEVQGLRYGLAFDFAANRHMRALSTASSLGRIEGILDRSEKLHYRLMSREELLRNLRR